VKKHPALLGEGREGMHALAPSENEAHGPLIVQRNKSASN